MTMGEAGLSIFSHALGKQEREERRGGYFWLEFVSADFRCGTVLKHEVTYENDCPVTILLSAIHKEGLLSAFQGHFTFIIGCPSVRPSIHRFLDLFCMDIHWFITFCIKFMCGQH